jgi:hypothetical protein
VRPGPSVDELAELIRRVPDGANGVRRLSIPAIPHNTFGCQSGQGSEARSQAWYETTVIIPEASW